MQERIRYIEALSSVVKDKISGEFDSRLRSLNLIESKRVRQFVDLSIRGVEVEPIPLSLWEGENAILVSNYPSVTKTTGAVLKVLCRLPGERVRLKAIARPGVITEANLYLKALGISQLVFPAQKDEAGVYRLGRREYKKIQNFLAEPGSIIWLSVTGKTRGNGLLEDDLRPGAAVFSLKSRAPIVPMGVVTKERKVVAVKFGEPISPLMTQDLSEVDEGNLLVDVSRLVMCQIARLLPPGQRGSFENVEEKLAEVNKRLEVYQLKT